MKNLNENQKTMKIKKYINTCVLCLSLSKARLISWAGSGVICMWLVNPLQNCKQKESCYHLYKKELPIVITLFSVSLTTTFMKKFLLIFDIKLFCLEIVVPK